jgi:hypothetical protein
MGYIHGKSQFIYFNSVFLKFGIINSHVFLKFKHSISIYFPSLLGLVCVTTDKS